MLRVGLTGGIGSGKSLVSSRLGRCGAWLIDSDRIAREVVEPGTAGLNAVVEEFGREILTKDGTLDRPALAARVFDDADARGRLNAIVHPLVAARSAELLAAAPAEAIVVHADAAVRIQRLVEQRDMAESDASARIAAQTTDERRRTVADVWLDNNGSKGGTLAAVDRLWAERLVPFEANLRHRRPAARPASPVLVAPDETWPQQARRVITRLAAVASRRAHRIDHIGSTAVPGLDAKDVLDVQVVVDDLTVAEQLANDLVDAGLLRSDGPWWDHARDGAEWDKAMATNADPGRAVNCHVRPADSPTWRETLLLRDWLRTNPASVQDYAQLKHRLAAQQWTSIDAYAQAKTPFVRSALDRAEQWALRAGWRVA